MVNNLDLRLEKIFTLAKKYRLGVMVDVFNVFNDDTITSWGTRIGNSATGTTTARLTPPRTATSSTASPVRGRPASASV